MKQWEYLILDGDDLRDWASLGDAGWELVAVVDREHESYVNEQRFTENSTTYYFKREKRQ